MPQYICESAVSDSKWSQDTRCQNVLRWWRGARGKYARTHRHTARSRWLPRNTGGCGKISPVTLQLVQLCLTATLQLVQRCCATGGATLLRYNWFSAVTPQLVQRCYTAAGSALLHRCYTAAGSALLHRSWFSAATLQLVQRCYTTAGSALLHYLSGHAFRQYETCMHSCICTYCTT